MKKLVKIYRNRAVFLEDNCRIVVEEIPAESAEILRFYEKTKKYNFVLDNI